MSSSLAAPDDSLDWNSFGFGLNGVATDYMWHEEVEVGSDDTAFHESVATCLRPFGTIPMSPCATIINYGQGLFEGLKAMRRSDGTVVIFRPDRNAARMRDGAERLCLDVAPYPHVFLTAINAVVASNAKFVPPHGKGALYIRPLLFGSGAGLGVKPSAAVTFCVYCSPVGSYFSKPLALLASTATSRAAPGGVGCVKASGNYAPAFSVQRRIKSSTEYDEVLFLDAGTHSYIEEAGASNFFVVYRNNILATPTLSTGTILPGVTRETILELAKNELGMKVRHSERLSLSDAMGDDAVEAFCCGTGAGVTPVQCIDLEENDDDRPKGEKDFGSEVGPITKKLSELLRSIQMGTCSKELQDKYKDWIHVVTDPNILKN